MKRCNECGWSNNPMDATKCVKCGAELDDSSEERISFQGVENKEVSNDSKKTVIGRVSDEKPLDSNNPTLKKENLIDGDCPSCGYTLRPGALTCPNCGEAVNKVEKDNIKDIIMDKPKDKKKTMMFGDAEFNQVITESYSMSLTETSGKKVEFNIDGTDKNIGRKDIDENNMSISSSHATFSVNKGKLNIEDTSSNNMTFVKAKGKTEVNDGDVIILGNQMFKVKFEKK